MSGDSQCMSDDRVSCRVRCKISLRLQLATRASAAVSISKHD